MADLIITAANVVRVNGTTKSDKVFGETCTAGQTVVLKETDSRWWKADNNVDAATASIGGIALNGGAAGQPAVVLQNGDVTIGATVAVGSTYVVSATAGGICPIADLASTNFVSYVGYAISTTVLRLNILPTGYQVA